jgi:hypothetical protein
MVPTSLPTPLPTVAPTPDLKPVPVALLTMTLFGMEMDVDQIPRIWESLVSQHVQTFWRSLPEPYNPIFIGNVTTILVSDDRVPRDELSRKTKRRATEFQQLLRRQQQEQQEMEQQNMTTNDTEIIPVDGNNTNFNTSSPGPMPTPAPSLAPTAIAKPFIPNVEPLVIQYRQTIDYALRQQSEKNSISIKSSLFLAPFEISPWDFLNKLATISNNSGIIVLYDIQIIETETQSPSEENDIKERTKNIAISVVVVVVLSLFMVGGYILYLVKCKEPMHENIHPMERNSPILGTVIGVNPKNRNNNHDVVISESYDDCLYYETPPVRNDLSSSEGPNLFEQQKQQQYMMEPLPSMRSSFHHYAATDYSAKPPLDVMDSETDPDQFGTREHSRSMSAPLESHLDGSLDHDNGAFLSLPPPSSVLHSNDASTEEMSRGMIPAASSAAGSGMERPASVFSYLSPPPTYGSRANSGSVAGEHMGDSRQPDDDRVGTGGFDDGGASSSEDRETNDDERPTDGMILEEPSIPFMSGFQLQIEDLE